VTERAYLSIGEVLLMLQDEFRDLTISKIRYLEREGLIEPERTPSGYRKFYEPDVERLRFVLREQKDHYLPLRVIKDRLDGGEATGPLGRPADSTGPQPLRPPAWSMLPGSGTAGSGGLASADASGPIERPTGDPAPIVRPAPAGAAHTRPAASPAASSATSPAASPAAPAAASLAASLAASPGGETAGASAGAGSGPGERGETANGTAAAASGSAPGGSGAAGGGTRAAGASVPVAGDVAPGAPQPRGSTSGATTPPVDRTFTLDELVVATGLGRGTLRELEEYGLLSGHELGGERTYDAWALEIASVASGLLAHGLEPRHLRMYRQSADREVSLFEQVVMPLLKQRNPQARSRAADDLDDLARLGAAMREVLVRRALRPHLP
jgi:DNA-binding transcriptional MerR regulator